MSDGRQTTRLSVTTPAAPGQMPGHLRRIYFTASGAPPAQEALAELQAKYPSCAPQEADVIVALGGDGFLLETVHRYMGGPCIFGMNRGSVGFLLNDYRADDLIERLMAAETAVVHPLHMHVTRVDGSVAEALAVNEVSLLRETHQAAKLRVSIDDVERMAELICDGILVATPAGSTAYNLSAHGPIIPIGTPLLALTPVSAFRPRRWRGALLPAFARVRIDVLEREKRPVSAVADGTEVREVATVEIHEESRTSIRLLFDPGAGFHERILREQFTL